MCMNMAVYNITLDIHKTGSQVALSMIRGENKRKIVISLTENGRPYKLTNGVTALLGFFTAVKSDNKFIYNECEIDTENNVIIYYVTSQTTAAVGEVKCQIKLTCDGTDMLFSPTFSIIVADTLYNEEPILASSEEFNALTAYVANLEQRFADDVFSSAIVCTENGTAISVSDSSESRLKGLNVYGKSTQDGTPTPEAPIEIISAGACEIFKYDANLYDDTKPNRSNVSQEIFIPANTEFTVGVHSSSGKSQYNACFILEGASDKHSEIVASYSATGWVSKNFKFENTVIGVKFYNVTGADERKVDKIMVCYGKQQITDANYMPYPENAPTSDELRALYGSGGSITVTISDGVRENVQTLVITTPNELRAVGDCRDYIDFERGVMVQNCEKIKYNGEEITTDFISTTGDLTNGATIIYALDAPVLIPLSLEQIANYKVLHTYYPSTTISNNDNAYMKVSYRADTKNFINKMVKLATQISFVTLAASNWVGTESPYSQVVTINGATKNSKIDLNPTVEQLSIFHSKDVAFVVGNNNGTITVYCIGEKPTNDYTMQVTITEVAANG